MPKELEQRLLEWATAINLVAENIDNCGIIKSIEKELKKIFYRKINYLLFLKITLHIQKHIN